MSLVVLTCQFGRSRTRSISWYRKTCQCRFFVVSVTALRTITNFYKISSQNAALTCTLSSSTRRQAQNTGAKATMAGSSAPARKLEGKVAVITGGASGFGERTARLFVEHGARVVVADIQDELGARLCAELGGAATARYVHCDVSVESDVAAAVDTAVAAFGSLDVMFNNAGIGGGACHSVRDSSAAEDFERVLRVNLVGPFLGAKHAARVMVPARRGGCIVSTSSVASAVAGLASHAYTTSKRALVGLTESLAAELGRHGVRVNCVSPGGVPTPLALGYMGLGREEFERAMEALGSFRAVGGAMRADDIANAVLFLASDDARHISGHNLLVDGGLSVAVNPAVSVFKD